MGERHRCDPLGAMDNIIPTPPPIAIVCNYIDVLYAYMYIFNV